MRRLRALRRRGLVTKFVDVDLLALAEKFSISDEQLNVSFKSAKTHIDVPRTRARTS
jgi:hypothetical protein